MAKYGIKKRKFGNIIYTMSRWKETKGEAESLANKLRKEGFKVRITKATHPEGYVVWYR